MRITAILNPKSKSGSHDFAGVLKEKFADHVLSIERTEYPRHATEIARQAVKNRASLIVAVGGDGTVNEVLNGMIGSPVTLGIIPTGTANDFASCHHVPTDASKACDIILANHVHRTDVIRVNDHYYLTAGGMGFPCDIARMANEIKSRGKTGKLISRILGSHLYVMALLIVLARRKAQPGLFKIRGKHGSFLIDPLWMMVNNQPFLGKNFLISPGAVPNDGVFDFCLVENSKSRWKILSVVLKVLSGTHAELPGVTLGCDEELFIETERPVSFFGDGQIFEPATKFRISILPGALKVMVPKKFFSWQACGYKEFENGEMMSNPVRSVL